MKCSRFSAVLFGSFLLAGAIRAQNTNQPQNGGATPDTAKPGVAPAAPPVIDAAMALPADCIQINRADEIEAGHTFSRDTGGEGPVPARLSLVLMLDKNKTWHVKCGLTSAMAKTDQFGGIAELSGVEIPVWTAKDSQRQFDFLRAEVKSTIETAITEKLVQSELVQEAVLRTVQDQTTVQNAIKDAVAKAIDAAIDAKIEAAVKKHLEQAEKDKSKTTASTDQH